MGILCSYNNNRKKQEKKINIIKNKEISNIRINDEKLIRNKSKINSYNDRRKKQGKERDQIKNKEINNIRINDKKLIKDISKINIKYNINNYNIVKIFGSEFVKNNKYNCKMIIDNKEYEIIENYYLNNYNSNILEINLKGINNVTNMSYMFYGCYTLSSLPDISNGILIMLLI